MAQFTGNVDLLVAAPVLQEGLVDKDGSPMARGVITCYHDNSRTTLKNWYYQSSNFADNNGSYTYSTLPNPLTLSAAGTVCDINGIDTIPFFYPYDELDAEQTDPYYITIVNCSKTDQITRPNFPFMGEGSGTASQTNIFENLIVNNGFWRNVQPNTLNITPFTSYPLNSTTLIIPTNGTNYTRIVAPSQHDGFRMTDIQFQKNNLTATDSVTFTPFPLGFGQPIPNSIVPEYYVAHSCTTAGSDETVKCYQFPVSLHVNTLSGVPFTVSIEGQSAGSGTNTITLLLLQDPGSGGTGGGLLEIGEIVLNSTWSTYSFSGIFSSTAGLNLGVGADDGWYIQVQMPLNTTCAVNFTKPSLYLTDNALPINSFQTYDQVDSIINSARLGDLRITTNVFYPYGWVPMNDGVIGLNMFNVAPTNTMPGYSRANADIWKLYTHFWNFAKQYDTGSNFNAVCQMYTNNGSALTPTNYGASPYADFTANNALQLTKMFGRALMGTVPVSALFQFYGQQSLGVTTSNSSGLILVTGATNIGLWQGAPITFRVGTGGTFPGNIVPNAIYYISNISGATFNISSTYAGAIAGTGLIAFASNGTGQLFINFDSAGSAVGEYAHTQLQSELVNHTHTTTINATISASSTSGPGSFVAWSQPPPSTIITSSATGGGLPFNLVEPGVFYNIFIKQ